MKQSKPNKDFDQILFSCEEMCYSIALAMSDNKQSALKLEREMLEWIWHLLDSEDGRMAIKKKIVKVLHKRFLMNKSMSNEPFENQNYPEKKESLYIVKKS